MEERKLIYLVTTVIYWCIGLVMFFACGDALYDKFYYTALVDIIVSAVFFIIAIISTCFTIKVFKKTDPSV